MRAARAIPAIGVCVALVGLALSGCQPVLQPCFGERFNDDGRLTDPDGLDGNWYLSTIDGQTIPATGYRLPADPKKPLDPPKFLKYGSLYFYTEEAGFSNGCDKSLTKAEGTVTAEYGVTSVATTSIANIDRKNYPGRFHHNHETGGGELGAGKYEVPISVSAGTPKRITIRATVDLFITDVTYTLVFTR